MSFTDQKPHIATEEDIKAKWLGGKPGQYFKCYLCGYNFIKGDTYRWVYVKKPLYLPYEYKRKGVGNFITCVKCDGEDVENKWVIKHIIAYTKFWYFINNDY